MTSKNYNYLIETDIELDFTSFNRIR